VPLEFRGGAELGPETAKPLEKENAAAARASSSTPRWTPFVMRASPVALEPLVRAALEANASSQPRSFNGAFTVADFNYKAESRLGFDRAVVSRVDFCTLDATSREPCSVDITLEPETVRWSKAGGEDIRERVGGKTKPCLQSSFRVTIAGLDGGQAVSKVEGLTILSQRASQNSSRAATGGATRAVSGSPPVSEYSNVRLTVPVARAASLQDWAAAVLRGGTKELVKEVRIELLGPDMSTVLFTLVGQAAPAAYRTMGASAELELHATQWRIQ
jgi:hypothetical protein